MHPSYMLKLNDETIIIKLNFNKEIICKREEEKMNNYYFFI